MPELSLEAATAPLPRPLRVLLLRAWEAQTLRYLFVGGSMALLYAVLLTALKHLTGLPTGVSSIAASALVTPPTYLIQRRLTFRSTSRMGPQFIAFAVTVAVAFAAAALFATLFIDVVGLPTFAGALLAAICQPIVSYVMQTYWVFRRAPA